MLTTYACGTFSFGDCANLTDLINAVVGSFFAVVWVVAIVFLAYGGLLWITSAGDKNKAETAKGALTDALIGIVIILGINVITSLLGSLLGGGQSVTTPSVGVSIPGL